jgi:hypothetical protein
MLIASGPSAHLAAAGAQVSININHGVGGRAGGQARASPPFIKEAHEAMR